MAWQRWHICPLLSPEWWPCQNVLPCSQSTAWALLLHIWAGSIIGVTLTILMHYEGALRCTCWLLCGIARPQLITVEIASFWNLLACNFCWKGGVITSFTARARFFFFLSQDGAWVGLEEEENERALSLNSKLSVNYGEKTEKGDELLTVCQM